ncbi:MAG: LamG-like jellyroll fold domain-containing protein, partial [Planctomycetia bacterium]
GEDLSSGLNLQGTTHTDPGAYSDSWSFISPNGNYTDVYPGVGIVNTIFARVYNAPSVALANDTGTNGTDGITSDGALSVTGVDVGNGIEYSLDYGQTWTGGFQAVEGGNNVFVRQIDGRGGVSPATPFEFSLDTQAPLGPGVSLANDTGTSATDRITTDGTLLLSGVESGAIVEYSVDGGLNWSASFTAGEGGNQVVVRQTDLAGNVSSAGSKLLALYRFDDPTNTGLDSSGRGNVADSVGASVGSRGYQNGAAEFDGTTYFQSPVDVSVGALPRLTWGAWVKPSSTNPIRAVLSADDGGYDRGIDIDYRGNGATEWSAFTGNGVLGSGVAPSPTDWVFVAAVYDQAQAIVTLYVDGTSVTATSIFGSSFTFFDIGHNPGSGEYFEGAIDNVFVYGDALTASQIADIRTRGFSGGNSAALSFEFTLDTQAAAPTVSLASDTGTNRTDLITSVADLTIGNVEPGATVEYSVNGGTWSTPFSAVEGTNVVEVRQVDVAGNVSPATHFEFTLDKQAAVAPTVSLTSDTGTNRTDLITSVADLTISNVETGATVEYSVNGGTWSTSFSAVEGTNEVEVRQFDVAGNRSLATHFAFTLDSRRPVAPVTGLANDTGSSPRDGVTSDGALLHEATLATLFNTGVDATGHLAANWATDLHYKLVSLPGGTNVVRVATAANGFPIGPWIAGTGPSSWIGPASDNVLDGPGGQYVYRTTFDLTGIDPASVSISGMWAADNVGDEILINGKSQGYATWTSPGFSSFEPFTVTGGFLDGINTLDFVLSNGGGPTGLRVEMAGTVSTIEPNGTVEYSTDKGSTWSMQWTPVEGLNQVLLRQVDPAGNASDPTGFQFTLDTQAAAPTVSLTSDTGTNRTDLITSVADLTIGNVEPGATVEYSVNGGTWSTPFSAVEGTNVVEVRQVDVAGNVSPATHFEFTLDTSIRRVVAFYDGFGTLMPDGIAAVTTLDFSACTVPLTFTLHPNGSLTVEDTAHPSANGLTFKGFGDILGGRAANRFVFVGSAAMAGRVIGNAMATNTLDYSASSLAVSVDLGTGLATGAGGFDGINAVIGSSANGKAGGNTLIGPGSGSVWTIESMGSGSVGGVVFSGINDLVAVAISDTLDYSLYASGVNVNLTLGAATGFRQITGFCNVVGTPFDDTLVGNARDNRVSGLAGDDTLSGLSGNDTFDGGAGTDTVIEAADVDFTLTALRLDGIGSDTLAGIERVNLTAGASANTITVQGWTGSATLTGGTGNDRYLFAGTEAANVTIVEGASADTDTLDLSGLLNGGVSVDLASTAAQAIVSGLTLTLSSETGIENVIGTAFTDAIIGNARNNVLSGLAGDDTLSGRLGNNTVDGGSGTDTVVESGDVDFTLASALLSGVGSDTLAGIETVNLTAGASANTLTVNGWIGDAILTGGAGNDFYVFVGTESANVTIVEVANTDTDTLDFTSLANGGVTVDLAMTTPQAVVAGLTLTLSSATGIENVIGTALADTLVGNARDNRVS